MTDLIYVSVADLKTRLNINDSTHDDVLTSVARSATRKVSKFCGQRFDSYVSTKGYPIPRDLLTLNTDPFTAVSSIEIDQSGSGNFEGVPAGNFEFSRSGEFATDWLDSEAVPYNTITRTDGQFFPFRTWLTRAERIRVTATWGWPAVPENVSEATAIVAAQLWALRSQPWGVAGSPETGVVRVQNIPAVTDLLTGYRFSTRVVGI